MDSGVALTIHYGRGEGLSGTWWCDTESLVVVTGGKRRKVLQDRGDVLNELYFKGRPCFSSKEEESTRFFCVTLLRSPTFALKIVTIFFIFSNTWNSRSSRRI